MSEGVHRGVHLGGTHPRMERWHRCELAKRGTCQLHEWQGCRAVLSHAVPHAPASLLRAETHVMGAVSCIVNAGRVALQAL